MGREKKQKKPVSRKEVGTTIMPCLTQPQSVLQCFDPITGKEAGATTDKTSKERKTPGESGGKNVTLWSVAVLMTYHIATQVKQGAGPLQKILLAKKAQSGSKEPSSKPVVNTSAAKKAPPLRKDPYIEAEELELARLSKLLGIDKSESQTCCCI